ncbi:imidazole glycerol phosphate synthase subunit HisH [Chloroflexus sp.]|uniref:imidazole glycerol phosphate synthase subunit HisH n=1 Tax=Chloroflexus sp. TaxID=1904827 RepID=UPI00261E5041|nr:imidazole glycerol phosphate synthase subunit HisH [uncultured Chloroflexus sp.]
MIAVINYGAGNLPNVTRALRRVGADLIVTDQPDLIRSAHAVVLPGVGATADTMASLQQLGIADILPDVVAAGVPFLGICVGMQVLLSESEEFGPHPCLNIVPGTVRRLPDSAGKIPQIGWNQIQIAPSFRNHPLLNDIPDGADVYFVHSYYCDVTDQSIIAAHTGYGLDFPSIIIRDRLAAVQFHPEKSGDYGLRLLANFVAWSGSSGRAA